MNRKTYGYAAKYIVEMGVGAYETFKWAKEAEFFLLSDAIVYVQTRCAEAHGPTYVRVVTGEGAELWHRRYSPVAAQDLPTEAMKMLLEQEKSPQTQMAVEQGNTLLDTLS